MTKGEASWSSPVRRRSFLGLVGLGAGASLLPACSATSEPAADYTVETWRAERPSRGYLVAHRGAGDVVPEHTIEAYEAALSWGAKALEVSVVRSRDGVLFCQHDLTLDRTTTLSGTVAKQDWSAIDQGRLDIARLGPRWQGDGAPRLARLDDVLDRVGHRAVLCIEAKDNAAFPAMVELIEQKGLKESVVLKLHTSSPRFTEAKEAGYPVFGYLGSFAECTPQNLTALAARLDKATDYLVLPSNENGVWLDAAVLRSAVSTGVPTWVFGVHRRSELARHVALGAVGAVVSSLGYLDNRVPAVREDAWATGALSSGEMTRRPESNDYGLQWAPSGVLTLARPGRQQFLTLGQLAPLRQRTGPYQLDVQLRVDRAPAQDSTNFSLAFAHADDRYYEHRQGQLDGYHALLRMNGSLELWSHTTGSVAGSTLAPSVAGPRPVLGQWIPLRLSVTPTEITWSRLDTGARVSARDARFRGDYVHVGRSAVDGSLSMRQLRLT